MTLLALFGLDPMPLSGDSDVWWSEFLMTQRRLKWLCARRLDAHPLRAASSYGDSISDLPLPQAVGHPQVVDPDARLRAHAAAAEWSVRELA